MTRSGERHSLRKRFEEVPELYERARPVYPAAVFDDLVALTELPPRGRILEIGCGTGQATLPLAERRFEIVCVELGEQLAAFARQKLAAFQNVEVINASFENWEPPDPARFDAVVAFTAFHWVDPELRYAKSARLLSPTGALAVVSTQHVSLENRDPFWVEVQEDYDAVDPREDNRPPPRPDEVADLGDEIEASGLFRNTATRRYVWDVTYSADEYLAVLSTYSGHRALEPAQRVELFGRIRKRIERRPTASVTKTYLAMLNVARLAAG